MAGKDWHPDDETPLPFCRDCGRPEGECDCTDLEDAGRGELCPCGASLIEGWCPACSDMGGECG